MKDIEQGEGVVENADLSLELEENMLFIPFSFLDHVPAFHFRFVPVWETGFLEAL